jgi:hypothetical protein
MWIGILNRCTTDYDMTIQEQIEWLRYYGTKSGTVSQERLDQAADTMERLLAVYEAALIWERDEDRTDETEHNLIMAVQAAVKDS